MDNKKLYEKEILNAQIETNEDEKLVNYRYKKLNGIMEPMYDFILLIQIIILLEETMVLVKNLQ